TYGNLSGSAAGTSRDFYAARYTSSGNLEWIKQLGTNDISGDPTDDMERSVAVDSTGNVVVAGISYNTSSDTNRGANDNSQAIALDAVGNIYLTGAVEGRLEGNVSAGSVDVFFTKIIASGD
ncbi:MAG: hypothetical protein GY754_22510, partial [bacterium]|nr:hypothetical protein [bacterium]